jgi:hypothetical protein
LNKSSNTSEPGDHAFSQKVGGADGELAKTGEEKEKK